MISKPLDQLELTKSIRDKVVNTFNSDISWLFPLVKDQRFIETDDRLIIFKFAEDCTVMSEGEISVVLFDDVVSYTDVTASNPLYLVPRANCTATLQLSDTNIHNWLRGMKIRPSYIMGEKYHMLQTTTSVYKSLDEAKSHPRFNTMIELKKEKYPDSNILAGVQAYHDILRPTEVVVLDTIDFAEGKYLCSTINFVCGGKLYCNFISMTDDKAMLSKHRAYIVGHVDAVKYAFTEGLSEFDCSMYFKYKEILNLDKTYISGVRINESERLI